MLGDPSKVTVQSSLEDFQGRGLHHLWREFIPQSGHPDCEEVFPSVKPETVFQEFVSVTPGLPHACSGEQLFTKLLMYSPDVAVSCYQVPSQPSLL